MSGVFHWPCDVGLCGGWLVGWLAYCNYRRAHLAKVVVRGGIGGTVTRATLEAHHSLNVSGVDLCQGSIVCVRESGPAPDGDGVVRGRATPSERIECAVGRVPARPWTHAGMLSCEENNKRPQFG